MASQTILSGSRIERRMVILQQPFDDVDAWICTFSDDELPALAESVEGRSRGVRNVVEVGRPVFLASDARVTGTRLDRLGDWCPHGVEQPNGPRVHINT